MIFDTDILIWIQRGHKGASLLVDREEKRRISIYTYLELLQKARSKRDHETVKDFLSEYGFLVLPLTDNVGHRAAVYMEEYSLSSGLTAGDAIIAATAVENHQELATSNFKHFKSIRELNLKVFRPALS